MIVSFHTICFVAADRLARKFLRMLDCMSTGETCAYVGNKFWNIRIKLNESAVVYHSLD